MNASVKQEAAAPGPGGPHGMRPGGPGGRRGMPDLTTGPIGRTLVMFALPVLGTNVLQSMNGTANAVWVSHALGPAALTATTNANTIFFLMLGAVFGITMAANLMIGQAIGAGDRSLAKRVIGTAIVFFLGVSMLVGLLGYTLTPAILTAMQTPPDAKIDAIIYLRVIFMAIPFMYFFSFIQMAQRGTGDSRTPFYFSLFAVAMEVTLNPLLILGIGPFPQMGIAGSATATLVSQTITLGLIIAWLWRKDSILILKRQDWPLLKPDLTIMRSLVTKGLPMGMQMLVVSGAALIMTRFVNGYGSQTAAAYGAAIQMWNYVQMPAMALGMAVSSMAAQNVGAGRMDRVDRVALIGSGYAAALSAGPILIIYVIEPIVMRLFLPAGSPSIPIAIHINSIVLWAFIPMGVSFVLSGIVRATGSVTPPLVAMLIALWVIRIPFAMLLEPHLGANAIWWSFPVGAGALLLMSTSWYRWGPWRKARLLDTTPRGEVPDLGQSLPGGVEETEAAEAAAEASREALIGSAPSAPNRPGSAAPAE
ncbi:MULTISPECIES: MATE family efflux transporter [Phenylobacterium]|uniref:MATE family efflux transporter n=1 Tax=Phenylobacterium conjunctum TaxID=1298959 RepID=A0ABW3SZ09_9CAUL